MIRKKIILIFSSLIIWEVFANGSDGSEVTPQIESKKIGSLVQNQQANPYFNPINGYGNPLIVEAASRGDIEGVQLLISQGVDLNAKDNSGDTALLASTYWGYVEIVKILVDAGADVNKSDEHGNRPIHWATYYTFILSVDNPRQKLYVEIKRILEKAGDQ